MTEQKVRNMEEFAALSGLSRPTLSKFFNDPQSVRPSTRERIKAALDRYDYTPNIYAINQNRRLTRNIGIVVPYLSDPFFAEVARILEAMCANAGFNPILLSCHGEPKREVDNLETLKSIRPAGVLLAPLGARSDRDALASFCADIPTVLFDCAIDGIGDAFFGSDKNQSVKLMVDYLCDNGEPPSLFEMQDAPNPNADKLHDAYVAAMAARGLDPVFLPAPGTGWNFEEIGYTEARRLMKARSLPTNTVLCSNDRLAIGFLAAAYDEGFRVGCGEGHALRVAGHDDHPFSRFTSPALTTIAQDFDSIAGSSLDRLLQIIQSGERPSTPETHAFDGTLIRRKSA
ncbi:MAG: LacI family DNA-binding transcriptional regulator [Pseudomonadota bacterium]